MSNSTIYYILAASSSSFQRTCLVGFSDTYIGSSSCVRVTAFGLGSWPAVFPCPDLGSDSDAWTIQQHSANQLEQFISRCMTLHFMPAS